MKPLSIVFAIAAPFLFVWSSTGDSNYGDALLGWPFKYAYAQSDAGIASFHTTPFLVDLAFGFAVGVLYILLRHQTRRRIQ
jgi:hypothetical protein